jgi:hypothetical protein
MRISDITSLAIVEGNIAPDYDTDAAAAATTRSAGICGGGAAAAEGWHRHLRAERVSLFADWFPDQGNHVAKAACELQCATYRPLQERLGYRGPPELLSMYLSFYMSDSFLAVESSDDPRGNTALAAAISYRDQHGRLPHPHELLGLMGKSSAVAGRSQESP